MPYLVTKTPGVDDYLGFGSTVVHRGPVASVISVATEHRAWQQGRLASGLMLLGGRLPNNLTEALDTADRLNNEGAYAVPGR